MSNSLLYFTKNDIPFNSAKLVIHNPTINELGLISEESFRIGYQMIVNIPKNLKRQDKNDLSNMSEFEIFIEVINQKENDAKKYKNHLMNLLTLLFPNSKLRIREKDIQILQTFGEESISSFIDNTSFDEFQKIVSKMFSFKSGDGQNGDYNPADKRAEMIAEKLRNAKKKDSVSTENLEISVYKRYASILSVGMKMDLNIFLGYTVNQLEDQFKRYILNLKWEQTFKMKLAGATGLDEVEDWMQEI